MAMPLDLHCWNCGAELRGVPQPVGRRENCPHCDASLHACRQCRFYDPGVSKDCREPQADEVTDKEAGNFCDYYLPNTDVRAAGGGEAAQARERLAQVFGGEAGTPTKGAGDSAAEAPKDAAAEARAKLDALFGSKKD